ncbi:MAG: FixH family protein [Myxococcota bacterium]
MRASFLRTAIPVSVLISAALTPACDSGDTGTADTAQAATDTVVTIDTVDIEDTMSTEDSMPPMDMTVGTPTGTMVMSDKGAYQVWFDGPSTVKVGVEVRFALTIRDMDDMPVTGLDLAPRFAHATMGHTGPKSPTASDEGGGAYSVQSVVASMSGDWNLDVTLPGADRARFVVTVTN